MAQSKEVIKHYPDSIMPFFTKGYGYVDTCDHFISSIVPQENDQYYRYLAASMDNVE